MILLEVCKRSGIAEIVEEKFRKQIFLYDLQPLQSEISLRQIKHFTNVFTGNIKEGYQLTSQIMR